MKYDNIKISVKGILAVCCLVGAGYGGESSAAVSDEECFFLDMPIVLTPSRLIQNLKDAPAAVTVIDREMIRATGYRDIPRLLRLAPGMQVGQERGSTHWVTYHGMGNDNPSWMQVLVDGRSVYSPGSFDGADWNGLPVTLDEVERIEIVRGTDSVAYGLNAFLGVINIITRSSADNPGTKASIRAGNAGIRDASLEVGHDTPTQGVRLNAEIRRDDGFSGLHDARRFKIVSLLGEKRLGGHDELMVRLAANSGTRELGYPDSTYNNNGERSADSLNAAFHLRWRHTPAPGEEWQLHYYHNQDRTAEEWLASAQLGPIRADVPLDRNRSSMRDDVELQHRLTLSRNLRAVWGLELRHDSVNAPFLYYGAAQQRSGMARLFGESEWRFGQDWSLNLNALAEKFDDDSLHVSPRIFTNWQVTPKDTARFGYARAWRQPTLFERYGDVRAIFQGQLLAQPYLPNPNLGAPRIDSLEMGYLGRFRDWDTKLDARLFMERIDNYIYRVSHPEFVAPLLFATIPSARYENLASPVTLSGLEYQLESRPRSGTRLLFNHTVISRSSDNHAITQLTAPYAASLSWMQDWSRGWSSTLTLLRMGPMAGGTGFVPRGQYVSAPYTTLDARLAYGTKLSATPVEFSLTATNLGGRHQEVADRSEQFLHGSDPVNRTSPMAWLTLTFRPE